MKNNPKKVKEQQEKVVGFLRQAMAAMGDDFAMLEARDHILQAIHLISKTTDRRLGRISAAMKFQKEAEQKSQNWWKMIQENALKLAKDNIEKIDESISR